MKKIAVFRFLLTALLCISLAACGGQGGEAGSSENTVGTDQGWTGDTAVGAGQGQPGETAAPVPARVPAQSSSEKKDILSEVEQVFDAKEGVSTRIWCNPQAMPLCSGTTALRNWRERA